MSAHDPEKTKVGLINQLRDIAEGLNAHSGDTQLALRQTAERLRSISAVLVDPVGVSSNPSDATIECPNCHYQLTVSLSK